ncbi:DUF3667 domain-containing protein [Pseudoduganella sp. OTU4001]|uniref:DUF3667 domain-containing protein n=1 Tax=Pseudoduganella sp. OTU4001 TaxID=3043854 RepID=UPI00313AC151
MKRLLHLGPRASALRPQHSGECHNCHATVSEKFCGQCGQAAHVHVASAHEFIHHFIGHYVALEGKLWATLRLLLLRPGQLTLEFIGGRRGRYIDPLRLLLTISLTAFLCLKLLPTTPSSAPKEQAPAAEKAQSARPAGRMDPLQLVLVSALRHSSTTFAANFEQYQKLSSKQQSDDFWNLWLTKGPTVALLLIPILAGWLKLVQLGRGWRYGEHLVFAVHYLSFSLFALALGIACAPLSDYIWYGALVTIPLYLLLAMHRVYRGGWVPLLLRWAVAGYLTVYAFKVLMWIVFYAGLALK